MRQINLLPEGLHMARERYQCKVSLGLTIFLTVLVIVMIHTMLGLKIRRLEKISSELIPPETQETRLETLKKEFKLVYSERERYRKDNCIFSSVLRGRISYPDVLTALSYATHQKVWLKMLKLETENGILELSGSSFNTDSMSEFLFRLKGLPFFVSVTLVTMEKEPGTDIINFNVKCQLR